MAQDPSPLKSAGLKTAGLKTAGLKTAGSESAQPGVAAGLKRAWVSGGPLAVLSVGLVGSCFLTWLQSGARSRNSFEVVRSAETLGFLEGWGGATTANIWYTVPLLASGVAALVVLGKPRLAAALAGLLGTLSLVAAWKIMATLPTASGPKVALTLAIATLIAAILQPIATRITKIRPEKTST